MKWRYVVLAAVMSQSCSTKKLAVNNADMLLENQIEKRLPLYEAQKKELSKDIDQFLNDHKKFVKRMIPVINDIELNVNKSDDQYDRLNQLYMELGLNFSNLMSKHMSGLDEKQSKDFIRTLKEENHRILRGKDEYVTKIKQKFKSLFGSINDEQTNIFDDQKEHFAKRLDLRVARRKILHERFSEIFEMDLSAEGKQKYFFEAFSEYLKNYPDSPKNKAIIKKIIPTLSLEQKEEFEDKTEELKEFLSLYLETHY